MMSRSFAPIPGFEGLYEAGPGYVRSLITNRVLRPGVLKSGYHLVVLMKDGVRHPVKEHRVIAAAFHGPCPDGLEVCHRDGVRTNNHPDNLYYGTKSQNQIDSIRHGTKKEKRKTHCPRGHLLQEPNLVASLYNKKGHRVCRACQKAHDLKRHHDRPFKDMADEVYLSFGMIGK